MTAGLRAYDLGGTATDALIAAQAVLCVVVPNACGLGGDMLALVHAPGGSVTAINGTGAAPSRYAGAAMEGAQAVTVPGIVDAWIVLHARYGKLPLSTLLAPAEHLARLGKAFH